MFFEEFSENILARWIISINITKNMIKSKISIEYSYRLKIE